ncbi:MAG: hypothetical protein L0226_01520 [Acidobacteria bacterium]|nr:hypothetical protein [Acidobacteriota bacterium]
MNRLFKVALVLGVITCFALCARSVRSAANPGPSVTQDKASPNGKVMREYKGVKLGMKREQVKVALGNPTNSSENSEDYSLTGDDTMTVHYENGEVKAIQLAFLDPKNAPAWKDVVGDAEVNQMENGAKHARKVVSGENFWVSIYQSKDGTTTRITISR